MKQWIEVACAPFNAQAFSASQHSFIGLNQTKLVGSILIQGNHAGKRRAGLANHADDGVDLIVLVILDPLLKRVDTPKHAFDPALGQHGRRPIAPTLQVGGRGA